MAIKASDAPETREAGSGSAALESVDSRGLVTLAAGSRVTAIALITLSSVTDVTSVTRYYLLQSSTLARPAKPTTKPPTGSWTDTEPTYTTGSTNSLYFVDLTVFSDGTWSYSSVSLSSSYEAAKAAYNKATSAQTTATAAQEIAIAKTTQFYQANEPESALGGDVWTKTDSDRVLRKDGSGTNMSSTQEAYSIPVGENVHSIQPIIIGGKTIVMNQVVAGNVASGDHNGVTVTNNGDGSYTFTGTATATTSVCTESTSYRAKAIANHVYLLRGGDSRANGRFFINGSIQVSGAPIDTGNGVVWKCASNYAGQNITAILRYASGAVFNNDKYTPQLFDLTMMFGADADAITTPEQAYALGCPRGHTAKNTGELVSADAESVTAYGFNLFNEFELDKAYGFNPPNVVKYTSSGAKASAPVSVRPNVTYYVNAGCGVYELSSDTPTIPSSNGRYVAAIPSGGGTFTTSATAKWILISCSTSLTEVCLNVSNASLNGTYSPYVEPKSFSIPDTIRAQYPLRSAGSAHDSYEYDEVIGKWSYVQRVGSVVLNTMNWGVESDDGGFHRAEVYDQSIAFSYGTVNVVTPRFTTTDYYTYTDNSISIRANNCRFRILSSTATTKQQFLDLMGDAVAYYELATPILTDITELMPSINIVNTEPGGLIVFEQEETALPIPTTLLLSPWTDITNDVNMIALQARDEASAAQETAESAQSTAETARTEFQRVVRINDEGLHVGDNQSNGEVLIDSNSVNVVFNGQKYSKFAANYVQFGNYQLRRSSDGGLVFKLS